MINVSKLTLPQIMGLTLFSFFIIMGFLAMKDRMESRKTSARPRRFPIIGGMEPKKTSAHAPLPAAYKWPQPR